MHNNPGQRKRGDCVVPNIKDSNYESNAQRDVNQTGSSVR